MDQHTAPNERQQYGEKFRSHTGVEKKRWRKLLDARFPDVITGVLSCYDRLMLQGTLPNICFAGGMEQYLRRCGIAYKRLYPVGVAVGRSDRESRRGSRGRRRHSDRVLA
jgi:hypothetical protein